jgi:predicted Zn-dependent protease with MMP-like domain
MAGKEWGRRRAPDLGEFEELAALAWQRLPREFRALCGDVVIRIEDFATEEVLRELRLESPFDLMGLYHGVSLDKKSIMDVPRGPDMVFLYRRALLDYWGGGQRDAGPSRHTRAGARDRPSFRLIRRRTWPTSRFRRRLRCHTAPPMARGGKASWLQSRCDQAKLTAKSSRTG